MVDSATASQTVAELDAELAELANLIRTAHRLRETGTDRKWVELSTILRDHGPTATQSPGKIIIFTEHPDTLTYVHARITSLIGSKTAIATIHGRVPRTERRRITADFADNPGCRVLLATDPAGEGLNLQSAQLMVNYDLPWNPNRIEQRFGRIHRMGQTEVRRPWNLVAENTREGAVFTTLLNKLDQMRQAYGGRVFDVLGEAFANTPLRDLLVEAIQYGQLPQTRARMLEVIDTTVGDGIKALLDERALASQHLSQQDVAQWRGLLQQTEP